MLKINFENLDIFAYVSYIDPPQRNYLKIFKKFKGTLMQI